MSSRSWSSGLGELASRARVAVADAFDPRGETPVVNIGFAEAPVPARGASSSGGGDLLALWSSLPVPVPVPEPEPEPELGQSPASALQPHKTPDPQRVFDVLIMPGILIEREKRVYVSASTLDGFHIALADRLAIAERFQVWQLDPLVGHETGELRFVESLDCLADKVRIHLELSDEALSQRAIDATNAQVFEQIRADMASYMEGAGPTARFDTWLKDSTWMKDTGGDRDENGVPLRAAGSVVRTLWDQEAAWQDEKRKDQEALYAQSQGSEQLRARREADITFSLKVCRGGVHAGGTEEVIVRSPDHTVRGLVMNICRRLKIPLEDGEELVLSIGNGDMCRVVRSLDQLPQSCPVQLWRAGSGPDAPNCRTSRSTLAITEHFHTADRPAVGASARLQGQLQLAVTHPDVRRAMSAQPVEKQFPKDGSATTPPHEHDGFLFTTYMTDVFAQIRKRHGIDPQQFFAPMMSLHSIPNPGGKSGASFLTTADGSFFLKSVTRQEFLFLTKLLPQLDHRLELRDAAPEQLEAPRVAGDPTPGSSAWLKAQQKNAPEVIDVDQALCPSTTVHYPTGSIALSRLVESEAAGKLNSDTPVYVDGMEEWLPLKQVRGALLAALRERDDDITQDRVSIPVPGPAHCATPASGEMDSSVQHSCVALQTFDGSVHHATLSTAGASDVRAKAHQTLQKAGSQVGLGSCDAAWNEQPHHNVSMPATQQATDDVVAAEDWCAGSLLPTFMGLYSVRGLGLGIGDTRFVVMRNGLPPASPRCTAPLSYVFDLKGSTRGRRASASERQAAGALSRVTLKDLDWRERFVTPVVLSPRTHQRLLAVLHADVAMLETMGVVDYSLLLGVHITSIEQSRLLPPPPSQLKAGQQTADVKTRASAEAAAFKADFDAGIDGALQTLSAAPDVDGSLESAAAQSGRDAAEQWDSSPGCKWVTGRAVVRSQGEERLCHFELSVSIVDVLSSGTSAVKTLEALKNKAMFESAASVLPAPEYSSRFLQFATSQVFACDRC